MKIVFHNGTEEAKPVRFAIDGGYDNHGFNGFVIEGRRWNGWLQPYVTHEVYLQIIAAYITPIMDYDGDDTFLLNERTMMLEWFEDDGFTHGYPHKDDYPNSANGLYSVGWGYCWDTQNTAPECTKKPTD